jgi:hypothetical protein
MAEGTAIGALAVRIGGDASGLISELAKSKTALGKFGAAAVSTAKNAAQITGAVAAAGAAIFAFTKNAADTLDQLGKMSQRVGVSVESLSALKHAAKLSDVSIEDLGTGLKKLARNMSDTQAGTGDARQAFAALGLSVIDSSGKLKGTDAMLAQVAEKFAGMEDGAGKTALAMRIFGKAGADLIPLLNQGKAGLAEASAEAERLGLVFSTQAAKDAEVFNDNLTRLSGAVEGVSIWLAGPLVKALGEASSAMLAAHRESEGFFGALARGWQVLVSGDDAHKLNVQISETTDKLVRLQDIGDELRRFPQTPMNTKRIEENAKAIQQTREELEKLIAIKPILAPEPPTAKDGEGKKPAPGLPNEDAAKQAAQREQEVRDVLHKVREEDDKRELEQVKLKIDEKQRMENEGMMARLAAIDWEQDQAIKAGEEELAIQEGINQNKRAQREREKAANEQFWNNLSGLMNTGSKKMFAIGKAASLGQAAVKGAAAVMSAWEAGMSVGGPWAPVVAAAYAAAAGLNALNIMNNIRSQQFGGGGSGAAPVSSSQGSSGISPVGAGGAGEQKARGPDTFIQIRGDDIFSGRTMAKFAERWSEFNRDGGRTVVTVT